MAHNKGINFWNAVDDDQRRFAGAAIICITVAKSGQNHVIGGQVSVVSLPFVKIDWCCKEKKFHVLGPTDPLVGIPVQFSEYMTIWEFPYCLEHWHLFKYFGKSQMQYSNLSPCYLIDIGWCIRRWMRHHSKKWVTTLTLQLHNKYTPSRLIVGDDPLWLHNATADDEGARISQRGGNHCKSYHFLIVTRCAL